MTRFEAELSGALGSFWKDSAEKELEEIRTDLAEGRITIDENGVARNCIGRALMSDMLEKLTYVTDRASTEATRAAREAEVEKAVREYRRKAKPATEEELTEMRAAFGKGQTVVNILTDRSCTL